MLSMRLPPATYMIDAQACIVATTRQPPGSELERTFRVYSFERRAMLTSGRWFCRGASRYRAASAFRSGWPDCVGRTPNAGTARRGARPCRLAAFCVHFAQLDKRSRKGFHDRHARPTYLSRVEVTCHKSKI